jgi:hypothetical protein
VIELSAKSDQLSDVSEAGVQLSVELATGVQLSDVSASGVHVSDVLGIEPQPKPIIIPTAQIDSTPIIPMDMTFDAVPTAPVPSTPVIAWSDITSAPIVPTAPVAVFPEIENDTLLTTEST